MRYELFPELDGVRTVVTGAGRGMGRGIAYGLARRGASIAVCDIDETLLSSTLGGLDSIAPTCAGFAVDVTDETSVRVGLAGARDALGGIDLLVNNAGVLSVAPVVELEVREWRRVLEVNATGVFLVSREAARVMIEQRSPASIITIASIAGKVGDPQLAHYSASKFAVVGFSQSLARELAPFDITVNVICPGLVETEMIDTMRRALGVSLEQMLQAQLIKRPQTPDEIAAGISFLHRNRSVTGQAINIDGGTVFH